ncbi:hypothetical protein B7494_g706 [Chlorociboria aeruginascens]|nr:hypothetical protein B7494_g706 [Chlorociboria aeruginascens]
MKAIIAGPITLFMVYRAWSHKSLTPAGIVAAALTAIAHAVHPWNLPFVLLIVFFLAGTRVTKVKHDIKSQLTMSAGGTTGGEGALLANSAVASALSLLHAYHLYQREQGLPSTQNCYSWAGDLLVVGIIANYAAVAADTFSSELGILSKSRPRLITSWNLRQVPPGTNGGVTIYGIMAGVLGSFILVITSLIFIPFCRSAKLGILDSHSWKGTQIVGFACALTLWGALGSVFDSLLGGWLQQSVVDTRTGRIIEGEGGTRVIVSGTGPNSMRLKNRASVTTKLLDGEGKQAIAQPIIEGQSEGNSDKYDAKKKYRKPSFGDSKPSRVVESGLGLLDNNQVNFLMALIMSFGAMAVASYVWKVSLQTILPV